MPTCKILVVDDFEPVRRLVCSVLEQRAEFQVIGQAAHGLEAIQKAEELQPDLILLDISLPKLNGIAAAREIRKLAPKSRILFLSENTSSETVEAALSTGASGYIVKSDAGEELLRAVEAVSHGRQFVSRRLEGVISAAARDTRTAGIVRHEVNFCSDDAELLDGYADYIAAALKAGNTAILVATEPRRNAVFSRLQTRGLDISCEREQGNYIALDVAETLSKFMVNGLPDPDRFFEVVGDLLRTVARTGAESRRIAACGDCAHSLWAAGNADGAIRIEQLWDHIATIYGVDILCGYELSSFHGEEDQDAFQSICAEHSAACSQGKELAARPSPYDKPRRAL